MKNNSEPEKESPIVEQHRHEEAINFTRELVEEIVSSANSSSKQDNSPSKQDNPSSKQDNSSTKQDNPSTKQDNQSTKQDKKSSK